MGRNIYSRLAYKHFGGSKGKGGDAEFRDGSFGERLLSYKAPPKEPEEVKVEPVKEASFVEKMFSKEPEEVKVEPVKEPSFVERLFSKEPEEVKVEPVKEPSFVERLFSKEPEPVSIKDDIPVVAPVVVPVMTEGVKERGIAFYILFPLVLLIALGCIGAGVYLMVKSAETMDATITIVNCQTKPCALTVNFTTKNGTAISGTRTVIGDYTEGQKIKVQYNPDSPTNFAITKLSSKAFGTIWLSIGFFVLVLAMLYYLLTR